MNDPLSGRTFTLDEYYEGSRVVAVRGDLVALADYAKGELLRIDRAAGTWSLATFEALARVGEALAAPRPFAASWSPPALQRAPDRTLFGRSVEVFRGSDAGDSSIEVSIDRSVTLSRQAAEILLGAAYPNPIRPESRAVLAAAAPPAPPRGVAAMAVPAYGLPVETTVTFRMGGERIVQTDRVLRIAFEPAPAALLEIPPGATRVEDDRIEAARRLESLDRLPSDAPPEN